jgi:iron complex outermembrane receptor protein
MRWRLRVRNTPAAPRGEVEEYRVRQQDFRRSRQAAGRHHAVCGRTATAQGVGRSRAERGARHGDIARLGGATPPIDRERKVNSLFGELNIPIVKNLEGNVAVRRDDYDDVGASTTYKASMRFQPVPEVVFRGSIGTGFRAPTLVDLWQPQTLGSTEQFNDTAPVRHGTDRPPGEFTDRRQSEPEAREVEAGFDWHGLATDASLSVAVDYFNIKVTDIIALPSAQEVVSGFRNGDHAFAGWSR